MNIDMAFMIYVAHESGLLTVEEKGRIIACMRGLELPVWHVDCTLDLIQKSLTERLKHSAGRLRMPLPTGLGQASMWEIKIIATGINAGISMSDKESLEFLCK